jgi:hypothetical protein
MLAQILVVAGGVELVQFLVAVAIHADTTRRQLDTPAVYVFGALLPLVGLVVAGAYFFRREQLPKQESTVPNATGTDGELTWTIEHRGLRRLPLRLGCAIQSGRRFWLVGVVAPPVFLALTVLLHPIVAIFLSMVCLAYWFTYLQGASLFTDTTVRLRPADQRIDITTRGGEHPLSTGGSEETIDLIEVERAALRQVGGQPLLKLQYENPLSVNPLLAPVAPAHVEDIRQTLAAQEIPLRDHVRDGTNDGLVRRRSLLTVCSLVAAPLFAGLRWPDTFVASPHLFFAGFVICWILLKPFA